MKREILRIIVQGLRIALVYVVEEVAIKAAKRVAEFVKEEIIEPLMEKVVVPVARKVVDFCKSVFSFFCEAFA